MQDSLRHIPSVDRLVQSVTQDEASGPLPLAYLTAVARRTQEAARRRILQGESLNPDQILTAFQEAIDDLLRPEPAPVINGTGVIVHTNLGRSPVSAATAEAMRAAATHYLPLEVDPESGERGGRGRKVSALLQVLTGAEASLIVNNNAAAVNLVLAALASGRKVVVSRSEAVEIGGGFRIPDVLRQSGAILTEVGTTNRTYLRDYADAIDDETAALLKVHASNFVIMGFTSQPTISELAELAHKQGIVAIEDVGSGCLIDPQRFGLGAEPLLQESIAAGADVVTASGDKLLGGPQAGIILGASAMIDIIKRHPLARAVRVDKTVQAGIAATLLHYLRGEATDEVPIWWSISRPLDWLTARVERWMGEIADPRLRRSTTEAVVGGGALPGQTLPSMGLSIELDVGRVDEAARLLRTGSPAVFPRIVDDRLTIDARTVLPDEDKQVVAAVGDLLKRLNS